jgi:hypothetical protein
VSRRADGVPTCSAVTERSYGDAPFRRLADFTPADVGVFDRLADQELDALLKERGDF